MYRKNQRSQQPLLISHVNELPERTRKVLTNSWAETFRQEVFARIREDRFAVLYANCPSRPNVPVNMLVGLEIIKGLHGWSDEELYEHFVLDMQVRYAVGCDNFGEGDFELRTVYNFRRALSAYALQSGVNLMQVTFTDITDAQIQKLGIKTDIQRMDSSDIAANIADLSRLELLITVVQRLYRLLSEADQARYRAWWGPYLDQGAGQYTYRIKGQEAVWAEIQRVGEVLYPLLQRLQADYGQAAIYATARRFFEENFWVSDAVVSAKKNQEISAGCLQSVDDLEASYRVKGQHAFKGYVTNVSETAHPDNPIQLVTHLSAAPNGTSDQELLKQDIPAIQARMSLELIVNDGEYVGPSVDQLLRERHIEQICSALTGTLPDRSAGKLVMADFEMQLNEPGEVMAARCPAGQAAAIQPSPKGHSFRLDFALSICQTCPFATQCPIHTNPQKKTAWLTVPRDRAASSQRRRRFEQTKTQARQLRPAIEATIFQLKHPFRQGKVLVRGLFRVTHVLLCAALAVNLRRMDRYQKGKLRGKLTQKPSKSPGSVLFYPLWPAVSR
ncbi:MAG TPA: transposase [Anaerolineaceae bacterium]|nr:transposase [Anaerolineaceae bacterium]